MFNRDSNGRFCKAEIDIKPIYEVFTLTKNRAYPRVTIYKNTGLIAVNQITINEYIRHSKNMYVLLCYDERNNNVGIKLNVHGNVLGAIKFRLNKINNNGDGAQITGSGFLKHFNIFPTQSIQICPEYNKEENMLILNLDNYLNYN